MKYYKKHTQNSGFTLIEIIVALGLFSVAVAISIGALVGLFNANSRAQAIASVMNNLNYSIENMTRIIRFATKYHCGSGSQYTTPNSCDNGDTFLAVSTSTTPVIFKFENGKIKMSYDNGSNYSNITSNEVTITYARFFVLNTTPGDNRQPYIILVLRGYAGGSPSAQSSFDIQTIISQKELDI